MKFALPAVLALMLLTACSSAIDAEDPVPEVPPIEQPEEDCAELADTRVRFTLGEDMQFLLMAPGTVFRYDNRKFKLSAISLSDKQSLSVAFSDFTFSDAELTVNESPVVLKEITMEKQADGLTWLRITTSGQTGWIVIPTEELPSN